MQKVCGIIGGPVDCPRAVPALGGAVECGPVQALIETQAARLGGDINKVVQAFGLGVTASERRAMIVDKIPRIYSLARAECEELRPKVKTALQASKELEAAAQLVDAIQHPGEKTYIHTILACGGHACRSTIAIQDGGRIEEYERNPKLSISAAAEKLGAKYMLLGCAEHHGPDKTDFVTTIQSLAAATGELGAPVSMLEVNRPVMKLVSSEAVGV